MARKKQRGKKAKQQKAGQQRRKKPKTKQQGAEQRRQSKRRVGRVQRLDENAAKVLLEIVLARRRSGERGSLNKQELIERTGLSDKSVDAAVRDLITLKFIELLKTPSGKRKNEYKLWRHRGSPTTLEDSRAATVLIQMAENTKGDGEFKDFGISELEALFQQHDWGKQSPLLVRDLKRGDYIRPREFDQWRIHKPVWFEEEEYIRQLADSTAMAN